MPKRTRDGCCGPIPSRFRCVNRLERYAHALESRQGVLFSTSRFRRGVVIGAIGVGAVHSAQRRHEHIALAALPLLLGAHQVIEAFVWLGLQGHVPHELERVALWAYLLIAFVVLPISCRWLSCSTSRHDDGKGSWRRSSH